jgi:hypothetical protein
MDFRDESDAVGDVGAADVGTSDLGQGFDPGVAGATLTDADAWIVDLDLGGLADLADVAVVAGVDDLTGSDGEAGDGDLPSGGALFDPMLAHDLAEVADGSDPFAALLERRLDDDEFRHEVRNLRVRSPFAAAAAAEAAPEETTG